MLLEMPRTPLAYDCWANERLFDPVALLDAPQCAAIRRTLTSAIHATRDAARHTSFEMAA